MILSDKTIKKFMSKGMLIKPQSKFHTAGCIQPASYDFRLGNTFKIPIKTDQVIDPISDKSVHKYSSLLADTFVIEPHSFVLATTMERVILPDNITAFVEGRSSIGRLGLFIQNAGWVDPGFDGHITLELFNASPNSISLKSGMRIAQCVFCMTDIPVEIPYSGKYQNQVEATESRIYCDDDKRDWGNTQCDL